jgi:FlaA1/EpsC-like NDP-sugar epimerase
LSGFSEEDIPIQFTGLRPGEKLVEELSLQNERIERTRHPKIFIGKIAGVSPQVVEQGLLKLQEVLTSASAKHVRAVLAGIVLEMRDWGEPRTPAA